MQFIQEAIFNYRFVDPSVQATFWGAFLGGSALCRLLNHTTECAATDTLPPLYLDFASLLNIPTPTIYEQYPDFQLYPVCAYALVPVYNLNGVDGLVLTTQILAKIWSGRITTWDHPDIQAINPNFPSWNVPANQSILLVSRPDTMVITQLLKKVMAAADPAFVPAANWGGLVQPIQYPTLATSVAYISCNPYTMGYAEAGGAQGLVQMARLNRSGVIVQFSKDSVQYAMLEKGLSFGNNGDDPAHLTGDLGNAVNPLAWPLVMWTYVGMRKATLRPGATCATRTALVNYWLWFWSSTDMANFGTKLGYVALPEVVRDQVVARFKKDMYCDGQRVWQEVEVPVVVGHGPESASAIIDKFQQSYALVNSSVTLNYTALASDQVDVRPTQAGGFLVSTAPLSTSSASSGIYSLMLGIEAVVAVSTMTNLVLDGLTLAKVLNGDITTWLHQDIVALNPNGLRANGQLLNNTAQRIVLLQGPTASGTALVALMQQYYPAYTGAAIQAAERLSREDLLWTAVIGTPFAFSVTALVGTLPAELLPAAIVSSGGVAVTPSPAAMAACTSAASYDPVSQDIAISPFVNSSCYPLGLILYVSVQRQCPVPPATARTVTFLRWMFAKDTLGPALDALNLLSLTDVSSAIQAANEEALVQLSCQAPPATPTDVVPLLLGIIIPIAVIVLLGLTACGWWFWKVTEYNRMLRKKFSNDNVAESCAEAIARFDLQAVAWLQEVKEPNKIQLAFLAIVTLLTEVKPYIPDQLLSRLTAKKAEAADGEGDGSDSDRHTLMASPIHRPSAAESPRRQHSLSYTPSVRSAAHSTARSPRFARRANQSIASSAEGIKQFMAMKDWRRKRCTYMCVRFGSTYANVDKRLPEMVRVAGQIVDIAKAHGATIDSVGVDVVNVHWGVANGSAASAIRAVQAGLEMAKLRATLPDDQQGPFWLQAGVGKGPCDCGTVSSASGHRFFVVWGPEANLAIEVAMANLPKLVLATVLVSPAVYQEVQFTVQCMPRFWHGDVLLWEPLCVLKKGEDDEWMYELQKMEPGASLSNKVMLEAFLMAKGETTSSKGLAAHVAELRAAHGGKMSPQDKASLDLLLAAGSARGGTHPHPGIGMTLDDVTRDA